MSKSNRSRDSGRYAYDGLDRVIHEKARLGILTSLIGRPDGLLFNDLKDLCALTDGNLSRHLTILQESGLIELWKGSKGNRPQTLVRITDNGQAKFREYLNVLESVIHDALPATGKQSEPGFRKGWSPA
jgi:DNA-binding MarR family transcriptional regulator